MKKITNWILHWWYTRKLMELKDVPFKMKLETDSLKSNCVLEIEHEVEPLWLSLKSRLYKLGIKSIQNLRAKIHRDDFGKQAFLHNPLFSENQIAEIKSKFWLLLALLLGFSGAEALLYKLTASLFVSGGGDVMYIAVSLLFTVGIMFGLSFGFETHFKYREVRERNSKKELEDIELLKYRDMRNIGYFVFAICFAAILFSGFARIYFLEYIPVKKLSPAKLITVTRANKMASIFSLLFTVLIAIVMAMIKRELAKVSNRYMVYKEWHEAHVRRNEHTHALIQDANKIVIVSEKSAEKHWQLIIDLKRTYKMETEYDQKFESLHQAFEQLKAQPGFTITDDIYRKFAAIQCSDEYLFKYGIMNAKPIKDKIDWAYEILKVPEEHLAEHLEALALMQNASGNSALQILPPTNGKVKYNSIFLNQ